VAEGSRAAHGLAARLPQISWSRQRHRRVARDYHRIPRRTSPSPRGRRRVPGSQWASGMALHLWNDWETWPGV